ncbi:hypothetical protein H5V45_09615 [Nocardioides sp. KIGAM211]|uniref:Uncharacterized protein n=1 Tax=Nocardioides luti TaxID=2761101 RepID=A0A7X0RFY1_9ACTN|nr:hypothetical protein [Nocardioides luti]MBB6627579.1 hypothetical protein [Nocardioides luti]
MITTHGVDTFIDENARIGLGRLLDTLLPGTGTLPPARDVADYFELLERVFRADPTLVAPVLDVARRSVEIVGELTVKMLESWGTDQAETVARALHSAYYMSTVVMGALHYPGQGRRPISAATPEERADDELLAPVRERGSIFVDGPDSDRQAKPSTGAGLPDAAHVTAKGPTNRHQVRTSSEATRPRRVVE